MNIKGILIVVISTLIFDLIFNLLNKFRPNMLFIFDKIPLRWKGKMSIRLIAIFILLVINASISVYLGLEDSVGYIIAGLIISICDFAFGRTKEIRG